MVIANYVINNVKDDSDRKMMILHWLCVVHVFVYNVGGDF